VNNWLLQTYSQHQKNVVKYRIMLYIFDEVDRLDDLPMDMLSSERRDKALKYRSPLSRKLSVGVYLLLCFALKEEYGIEGPVDFGYNENGKPFLKDHQHIHFNLSHCKKAVACAVSDSEVGVDVQDIRPVSDKVAKRVLTEAEYGNFKVAQAPDEYFCEIWTVKESFLKRTGQGIREDLRKISAENIIDRTVYRGDGYFCCVTGMDFQMKRVGREDIG